MRWLSSIVVMCALVAPASAQAQFDFQNATAAIELQPSYPLPDSQVDVTINAYTYDTTGATIRWYIDGIEEPALQNRRGFSLETGALGVPTTIDTVLILRDGGVVKASKRFTPSDIDLVIDADTIVPAFYQGRPLPSIGSTIQVVALPKTGRNLAPNAYSYTWRFENEVVEGGSVAGGYIGRFQMPMGRGATLRVDVSDDTGQVVAQKIVLIPNQKPELLFYKDNPLRGLDRISIDDSYQLLGSEVTVRAEPYFMDRTILLQNPHLEWKIDGRTVENPSSDKQNITLQNAGGTGSFAIEFHLRNLNQLLQGVRESFNLYF